MPDSPDRLMRLMALFEEALDLPAERRAAWLAAASPEDPALRDELAALLEAHDRTGGVLDRSPVVAPSAEEMVHRLRSALADRYDLGPELGRGGMATVFLAHERKHERPVVIKVLQPEVAAAFGPARFLDEVRIAARLSHPHILGLIDSGEADGLLYYVMPHVRGETLRERLRREGALPPTAAITILRDIAAALAHAHAAGIVHRDLKPDNVLVVEDHAFLMDFGIAKLESEARLAEHRTDPAYPLGTPGYMAPEQAAGRTVDHRADLYAWGLVGRELLTGYPNPVPDLVGRRPDAPAELPQLVERCLAPEPADRIQQADELVDRLDALVAPVSGARRRRARVAPGWPVAVAGVAALAGLFVWRGTPASDRDPVPMPVAVAVFRNETGDSALTTWGRMAGDWITQGLHETGLFQVVPWPSVLQVTARHEADGSAAGDPIADLRDETGARTVVSGAYYLVGDALRFQVEISDAREGRLLAAPPPVTVPRDSAAAAIQAVRDRVMGTLAVRVSDRLGDLPGLAERPPTFEAYRIFDRGLVRFNAQDYRAAVTELRQAAALDTTFAAPLVYAAFGAANTDQPALVDSLLAELARRRAELNEYEDHQRQYLEAVVRSDAPRALAAIRAAERVAPGSRAGYNAALTALTMNRAEEALAHLQALDPERGLMRGWSSYWTQLTHALHLLGRHEEELAAARTARTRYPDRRVNLVLEARALAALGRTGAVDSLLAASETLPADTYWSQAAMMVIAGEELLVAGRVAEGEGYLRRAIAWLRPRAFQPGSSYGNRQWLATALYHLGQDGEAADVFAVLRGERADELRFRGHAALLAARRGDGDAARRLLGEPRPREVGEHTVYRARLAAVAADTARAASLLTEALARGVDGWSWVHSTAWRDFAPLREDPRIRRLMAPVPAPATP